MIRTLLLTAMIWLTAAGFSLANPAGPGDPLPIRERIFFAKNGDADWLVIKEGVQITAADLLRSYKADLGLSAQDALVLYRTDHDELGFSHYRYQQYHRGVKVEGGELLIHEKDGFVRTLNGKLVRGLNAGADAALTAAEAIQQALDHTGADGYMWEDAQATAMLRRIKKDPQATFYPQPELVLVDPSFEQNPADFQLAWSMVIYATNPHSKKQVFVNALTGAVAGESELLHDQNTPGTAQTKYSGTRTIITDSTGVNSFRLIESTRGGGIETYNLQKGTDYGLAVDFTDQDNYWNNVNANQDEAATDVHWGAEMTFDYYHQAYGYDGIDGNNMPLIGYVHYDNNWSNARWTGDWAEFGDGNGSNWAALTALDVVGHEFTHGVTGNNAKLKYQNESGALNESFSDIFGAAIEFWADPAQADWLVGEDFISNGALRSMSNPKEEQNPDTYKGQYWATGTTDNGGVHTNSGVQNHWFYLLSDGGSGENDKTSIYSVAGVGVDTAAAIAFRNLRYYLVQLSIYKDAREGSLQAAEDMYGICSNPVVENAKAWYAVGVGSELLGSDLHLLQIVEPAPFMCGLVDSQFISIQFRYNGCVTSLQAGDQLPLSYQIDNNPAVWDTLTLSSALSSGDTLHFTFPVPTSAFSTPGTYTLYCKTGLGSDINTGNDGLSVKIERFLEQNVDLGVSNISKPSSGCFLANESPSLEIGFFGCDSIAANEQITVFYSVDGATANAETIALPNTLYRGDKFEYKFNSLSDFSGKGPHLIDAWVQYGPDFLTGNDSLNDFRVLNPLPLTVQGLLAFEGGAATLDSIYVSTQGETVAYVSPEAKHTGANGYYTAGGDLLKAYDLGDVKLPNQNNIWNINEKFRSDLCICADLSNLSAAQLKFERKQTYSNLYLSAFGANYPYFSALRILVNGEQISATFKPSSYSSDPWFTHYLSLNDFVGNTVEICFQTHTGLSPALDPIGKGDKVFLDNIAIVGQLSTGTNDVSRPVPEWSVMPNPGTGAFIILYKATEAQTLSMEVSDALGRVIRRSSAVLGQGDNKIPLDLQGAAAGVYFVRLGSETEGYTVKKLIHKG